MNKPLNITVKPSDYHAGDGQLKLKGVTTSNWISHFDFFVSQLVLTGDTDDCWDFAATKNLDAYMDALIADGVFPASVVQQITDWGFMDTGIDGNLHFHSSERFAAVLSGLGQNGGQLNTAYDIFRKYGVVPFKLLPVTTTMTLEEYFAPAAITPALKTIGTQFLALMGGKDFVQYQWINNDGTTNIPKMAAAIVNGPLALGIPVFSAGWNQVHPTIATGPSVHVVSCYEIVGQTVPISDNYPPFLKILDAGYEIPYVMQMIVQYIAPIEEQIVSDSAQVVSEIATSPATPAVKETLLETVEDVVKAIETIL